MVLKRLALAFLVLVVSACLAPGAAQAMKFTPAPDSPLIGVQFPSNVATGDFDGDGDDDLVVSGNGESGVGAGLYVWLSDGDGTFTPAQGSPFAAGTEVRSAQVGHVNPDDDQDLDIIYFAGSSFSALLGDGDGTFTPGLTIETGTSPSYGGVSTAFTDINDDGFADVVVGGYPNRIRASLNDGAGWFTVMPEQTVTGVVELESLAVGDFNGDGDGDLAVTNFSLSDMSKWQVYAMRGNGDGTFTNAAGNPFTMEKGNIARAVTTVDLNEDGLDDLAVATQPGNLPSRNEIQTLLGSQTSLLAPNPDVSVPSGDTPFNIFSGDLDGDGVNDDPATGNFGGGSVSIGRGTGTGDLLEAGGSPFSMGVAPPGLRYFAQQGAYGDFNGDGAADIAVNSSAGGTGVVKATAILLAEADLVFDVTDIDFGDVLAFPGTPAAVGTATAVNEGTAPGGIESVSVEGANDDQFRVLAPDAGCETMAQGDDCELKVEFKPTSSGAKQATLVVETIGQDEPIEIALSGTGVAADPKASLSVTSVVFGEQLIGSSSRTEQVTLTSNGNVPYPVKSVVTTGDSSDFTFDFSACSNDSLLPGASCQVTVAFAPKSSGAKAAALTFMSAPEAPNTVLQVSGTGTVPNPPPPEIKAELSLKSAKKVKRGKKLKVTATVKNTGEAAATGVTLRVAVPKKLAKAPKKVKVASIPVGRSVKKTFTVTVKKKAKKGKKLKVKVTANAAGKQLSAKTRTVRLR